MIASSQSPWNNTYQLGLVLLLGCLLSVFLLWPYIDQIGLVLPNAEDAILVIWQVGNIPKLLASQDPTTLPFFHPIKNTLAFSQPMLFSGIFSSIFFPFITNLLTLNSILLWTYSTLHFTLMYWAMGAITKNRISKIIAALLFAGSPLHIQYVYHLQAFNLTMYPVVIGSLLRFIKTKKIHFLSILTASFVLQSLEDPHHAVFISMIVLILTLTLDWKIILKMWKPILFHASLSGIALIMIFYPWIEVSKTYNYVRTIRDAAHFANSINFLLSLQFLSLLIPLIILIRLSLNKVLINVMKRRYLISFTILCLAGIILSLGPVLKLNDETLKIFSLPIPLPYAPLYYLYPGFQIIRASSRFIVLYLIGSSMLTGLLINFVSKKLQLSFVFLITIMCILMAPRLNTVVIIPKTPEYVEVLSKLDTGTVAEFPVLSWNMRPYNSLEHQRLLWQYSHNHPLYNGVSGFMPQERVDLWHNLWLHLNSKTIDYLRSQDVSFLVVDFDTYNKMWNSNYDFGGRKAPNPELLEEEIDQQSLKLIWKNETHAIYDIRRVQ